MQTQQMRSGMVPVAGAELYHEIRGTGIPVLLVPGLPGDAGQFAQVADGLAERHQVVTYDRRGYSRSPRPAGWDGTSVQEQAADAAALLDALVTEPAVVYGTSNGALFALELALTRPELVGGLIVHEPPLLSVLAHPGPVGAAITALVEPAFAAGGANAALEAFLRFAYGDGVIDGLDPRARDRMLANGDVAMTIELPATQAYRPSIDRLDMPVEVLLGTDQLVPFFREAAGWVAEAVGTSVSSSPGGHGPQFEQPRQLAEVIDRFATAIA